MERVITKEKIEQFHQRLICTEKSSQTIRKYLRDIRKLQQYAGHKTVSKELLVSYKTYLEQKCHYKVSSINSYLAVVNHFCACMGWNDLRVKMIRIQQDAFAPENREMTQEEYARLIRTAQRQGDEKLSCLIQTLGSTGIRISELCHITVESLRFGMAEIHNKGKMRRILYPGELQKLLKKYAKKEKIESGPIFRSRSGKPLDRSNIWRMMKRLSHAAKVDAAKVYPHSMRHLFARCFYKIKKDIAKLADVLGHSSIEITRIYIKSTGREHKRQLDSMRLVIGDGEQKKTT